MNKIIIVTGGGTGGHLSVAKALMEQLHKQNYKIIYIGSTKGADKEWFENDSLLYKTYFFDTRGVVNQNIIGKLKSMFMILKAVYKSYKIMKQFNIKKVISVGGFSAAAASFAAILSKKELYIHEQNSVMGKLNQITSKWAKEVFSSYDKTSLIKDYPINPKFFEHFRVRKEIKTIIFLGGSQGARAINNFALKVAPILNKLDIKIIHQAGKLDFQRVQEEYMKLDINVDLFYFTTNILEKMDQADFAISRSGASTLWELSAIGMPTLYVPYPWAAANHQYFNAKFLLKDKLCLLANEKDLNVKIIDDILKQDIAYMSENLQKCIHKNGAKQIIDKIGEL